ncbi:POLG alternative reading frame-like [Equus asinus]|uniref:POLG alternative reading frame-like n=1 Tax=Equus asinus TaxID=9793 RepID=UPI0038F609FC
MEEEKSSGAELAARKEPGRRAAPAAELPLAPAARGATAAAGEGGRRWVLGGCVSVAEQETGWAREARRGAQGRRPGAHTRPRPPRLALRLLPRSAHPRAGATAASASSSASSRALAALRWAAGRGRPGSASSAGDVRSTRDSAPVPRARPGRSRAGAAHTAAGASLSSRAPASPSARAPSAPTCSALPLPPGCRAEREGPQPRGRRAHGAGKARGAQPSRAARGIPPALRLPAAGSPHAGPYTTMTRGPPLDPGGLGRGEIAAEGWGPEHFPGEGVRG